MTGASLFPDEYPDFPDDPIEAAQLCRDKFKGKDMKRFRAALEPNSVPWHRHLFLAQAMHERMGRSGVRWEALTEDRKRALKQRSKALGIDLAEPDDFWRAVADVILPFDPAVWESWSRRENRDLAALLRTSGSIDWFQRMKETRGQKASVPSSVANAAAYRKTTRAPTEPVITAKEWIEKNPEFAEKVSKIGQGHRSSEETLAEKQRKLQDLLREDGVDG